MDILFLGTTYGEEVARFSVQRRHRVFHKGSCRKPITIPADRKSDRFPARIVIAFAQER
jgi:hypothetical protein